MVSKKIARRTENKIRRGIYDKCDVEREKVQIKIVCNDKYKYLLERTGWNSLDYGTV